MMPTPRYKTTETNGQPIIDNRTQDGLQDMVYNEAHFRRNLYKMFLDRRRNIEKECGYPDTAELDADFFKKLYEREPLAARVVDLFPKGCWQTPPHLFETKDVDEDTEFEKAWVELGKNLNGPGFFKEEGGAGNPIWEMLERVDRLSGIGTYGVILLGLDGELDAPVELMEGGDAKRDLLFMRALDETMAEIAERESDTNSPRFGLPISYNITIEQSGSQSVSSKVQSTQTKRVHWSRVIHIADNLENSHVFGAPRMRTVHNRLYDLYKVYGGSAEMYWLAAFFGISFETHPQVGPEVKLDIPAMRKQIENYQNTLQRWLAMPGMTAKTLAPQVSDPTAHIDVQLEAICIYLGVPKRIFLGSERGELSSSQDARAWYAVLKHRQNSYVTPRIIVPFVDRLIQVGVLPVPDSYGVKWTDIAILTEAERAEVASKQTDTMAKYISGNVEAIMDPLDFYVQVMDYTDEEAITIIANRMTTEIEGDEEEEIPGQVKEGEENGTLFGKEDADGEKLKEVEKEAGGSPRATKREGR